MLKKIARYLLGLFIFLHPWGPTLVVYAPHAYDYGQWNYFAAFSWPIIGFLLPLAWFFFLLSGSPTKRLPTWLIGGWFLLLLTLEISTFQATDPLLSLLYLWHWIDWLILIYLLYNELISPTVTISLLGTTYALQALLAVGQVLNNGSFGLSLLGEGSFNSSTLGTAKIKLDHWIQLRGYGTLTHPNILAGILATTVCLWTWLKNKLAPPLQRWWWFVWLVLLGGIIATWSRSAGSILFIIMIFITFVTVKRTWLKTIVLGGCLIILFALSPLLTYHLGSLTTRWELTKTSFELLSAHPWGVGSGNMTLFFPPSTPWEAQPVHNIFLLTLVENGILGLLVFTLFWTIIIYRLIKNTPVNKVLLASWLVVLWTSLFDHYWLTNPTAWWIIAILSGLTVVETRRPPKTIINKTIPL